jgi:hypothetical protein
MNGEAVFRLGALAICCLLLFGLLVLGGSGWRGGPDPERTLTDRVVDAEDHAGKSVGASGVVVETDPVVVEIEGDDGLERVRVKGVAGAERGERLSVYGTVEEGVLHADPERAAVQEPWEYAYMYLISMVGVLLVAVRGIGGWRVDLETFSLRPREEPPYDRPESTDG